MLARERTVDWRSRVWGIAVAALALVLFEPREARADPGVPIPPNGLLSDEGAGAVSDADRDFVIKVRLAGLWEIPAGAMAQQKSDDARIRRIGREIAQQHRYLDKLDREAAKKLKIKLPDDPNEDQQKWLAEMEEASGADFDQIYIDRLRAAHGKIFPAIATIRASTRNDTVRKLAQQANQFVMTHMTLLESSGIVDYAALPTAPPPSAAKAQTPAAKPVLTSGTSRLVTPLIFVVLVVGLFALYWTVRRGQQSRRGGYRRYGSHLRR